MPIRHVALAVLVSILWGLNFVAIHVSLEQFPPFLLAALRFLVVAVPTVVLVPRPAVQLRWLIGYGLGFGTLHIIGLYAGMAAGFPAGLASLVLQSSAPFTVLLGVLLLHEPLTRRRAAGVTVAVIGLTLVGVARATQTSWVPFVLVLLGGLGWAIGNLASRQAAAPNPLHFSLWMCVVPPLPLFGLSLVVEGPTRIGADILGSFSSAAVPAWAGFAYTAVLGTVVGSAIWVWLITRHPAGHVAPFSMLVPVTGMVAGWVLLAEVPTWLELVGGVLVIIGVLWSTTRAKAMPPMAPPSGEARLRVGTS